jgi:uncharacterized protein YndB with AHSA1/START domain
MTIELSAPVITRDREVIAAPLASVWAVFTGVDHWTNWNEAINKATLDGPLAVASAIHWTTAGMEIVSTIGELIPH